MQAIYGPGPKREAGIFKVNSRDVIIGASIQGLPTQAWDVRAAQVFQRLGGLLATANDLALHRSIQQLHIGEA